jgi:hypothetical protein
MIHNPILRSLACLLVAVATLAPATSTALHAEEPVDQMSVSECKGTRGVECGREKACISAGLVSQCWTRFYYWDA